MRSWKESLLAHLDELSFFASWRGENPFKIRAYERAAESLSGLDENEIRDAIRSDSLTQFEGIGKGIAQIIKEFEAEADSEEAKRLRAGLPSELMDLRSLGGLGVKKIKALYEGLHIRNLGELEYACQENRLSSLPGFGAKTQEKISQNIERLKQKKGKLLLSDALREAELLEEKFKKDRLYSRAGALAQKREIIENLEYLVEGDSQVHPLQPKTTKEKEIEFTLQNGIRTKFYFCKTTGFYIHSVYRSSSPEHWESLKKIAQKKSIDLRPDRMTDRSGKNIEIASEPDFYKKLGLSFWPPETREWSVEDFNLPSLAEISDLKGAFHAHTRFSDGKNTVSEMGDAAKKLGWKYLGLSEHSQSAAYAGGIEPDRIASYRKEIEDYNSKQKDFRLLAGIESDILKDGSLDYPPSTLKKFDFVIASIHQRYGMKDMTDRLIAAIENPYTRFVGHISGRLLLGREAYTYDLKKVVGAAIKNKVAIELNASPQRLDMAWQDLHWACQQGLLISINPDAHSVGALKNVDLGISMAKKAGVASKQIVNTWSVEKTMEFLKTE